MTIFVFALLSLTNAMLAINQKLFLPSGGNTAYFFDSRYANINYNIKAHDGTIDVCVMPRDSYEKLSINASEFDCLLGSASQGDINKAIIDTSMPFDQLNNVIMIKSWNYEGINPVDVVLSVVDNNENVYLVVLAVIAIGVFCLLTLECAVFCVYYGRKLRTQNRYENML